VSQDKKSHIVMRGRDHRLVVFRYGTVALEKVIGLDAMGVKQWRRVNLDEREEVRLALGDLGRGARKIQKARATRRRRSAHWNRTEGRPPKLNQRLPT